MEKILKTKFLAISEQFSLQQNAKVVQQYKQSVLFSKYAIPYSFGLLFSTIFVGTQALEAGFIGGSFLALVLSVPMSFLGLIPGIPLYKYFKKNKFKIFRKSVNFRSLQDSYFYINDKLIQVLQDKETQFVFYNFFNKVTDFIELSDRKYKFMRNLELFQYYLSTSNFSAAAESFFKLYPQSLYYIDFIAVTEDTQYEKEMLEVQANLIQEYLGLESYEAPHNQTVELEIEKSTLPVNQEKSKNWRDLMSLEKK
jgi:hypothetical protein